MVVWKAPEVRVRIELPKGYTFKQVYSRKALISHESGPKFQIVLRQLPSMVVTEEDIRRSGGHHHHEPENAKRLAQRIVGTARAMNGRTASGRTVKVLSTRTGKKGDGVWFGEEIYTITDQGREETSLFCQRVYYSKKFTFSLFLERKLKKGDDAKAIYGPFEAIANSVELQAQ